VSKVALNFREADIRRAVRAALASGLKINSIHYPKDGGFELRFKGDGDDCTEEKAVTAVAE